VPPRPSWIEAANAADCPFPLDNLPCGVFSAPGRGPRCGVAIGAHVLDVAGLEASGLLALPGGPHFTEPAWNALMAAGPAVWAALRARLTALLADDAAGREQVAAHLVARETVALHLPFRVAEFTDFYSSRHHALNVGALFRDPADALPPNWDHMPIGYNGRASSVVVSGTDLRRPWGQIRATAAVGPAVAPSRRFDFELEIGAVVGPPSESGQPVTVADAEAMIFGYVLLNDWSARDIQAWEYQPLGPFQSKATATTISPWIVTSAALAPFRVPGPPHPVTLLPHLRAPGPLHLDLALEVALRPGGGPETVIVRSNPRHLSYSAAQQLAHHTSSGCPMRTGDLIGSGTISGPEPGSRGCLLEITEGGRLTFDLPGGGRRGFLEDHDTVTLRGAARRDGVTIGFGDCAGTVLPALADPYGGDPA